MCIRKDIAEKKVEKANKEADERVMRLQTELDDLKNSSKRKEKEFEETMNHLQADIEQLESERGELKDKVKTLSKRTVFEGLAKNLSSSASSSPSHGGHGGHSISEAAYAQQVDTLRQVIGNLREEIDGIKLEREVNELKLKPEVKLPRFKPNWLLRAQGKEAKIDPVQERLIELTTRSQNVQRQLRQYVVSEKLFDLKKPIQQQVQEENLAKQILMAKYRDVERDLVNFMKEHSQYQVTSDLNKFTAPQLGQIVTEQKRPAIVARLSVPCPSNAPSCGKMVPIEVTMAQLRKIHEQMV
jgi:dynactin 1